MCSDPTADWLAVSFGEPDGTLGEEFDNDFAAANVGVEVRNLRAAVIARDGTEADLTNASAPHLQAAAFKYYET